MKSANLVWRWVDRVDLLPMLIKLRASEDPVAALESFPPSKEPRVRLGVSHFADEKSCPVVVVADSYINEFFAWLYTFAEDAMPLSMHCKVLKSSDFEELEIKQRRPRATQIRKWSSIVTGEIMSRLGAEKMFFEGAASWALFSYSFAATFAYASYSENPDIIDRMFLDRLRRLPATETSARNDYIQALEQIWTVFSRCEKFPHIPREAVIYSFQHWIDFSYEYRSVMSSSPGIRGIIINILEGGNFESESLEQRVVVFDKFVDAINQSDHASSILGGFGIAAAAFFVGKGTSHIHLLDGQKNKFAYLWIALFAGLCDENFWDVRWISATRKVEALISFYSASDFLTATLADLSWVEYNWILQSKDPAAELGAIPKIKPHAVMVEILPGIPLEVRLTRSEKISNSPSSKVTADSENNLQLASRLEEIARELRNQNGGRRVGASEQDEFELEGRGNFEKSRKRKR